VPDSNPTSDGHPEKKSRLLRNISIDTRNVLPSVTLLTTVVIASLKYYSCVLNSLLHFSSEPNGQPHIYYSYTTLIFNSLVLSTHTFEHHFVNCFLSVHLVQIRTADKTVECQRWVYQFHPRRTLASVPVETSTLIGWCRRLRRPYNT
jgi:hypothetical protein